jgi:DNA-binding NarL/FixJ family response regulator
LVSFSPGQREDIESDDSSRRVRRADRKKKRILLVEDHAVFRESLALLLTWQTGSESFQAGSVAEALDTLGRMDSKVDLVVIDLDLPNGDGVQLIEELRKARTDIPVIALTIGQSLERHTRTLRTGVDEVLSTVVPLDEIIGTVKRFIGGYASRREGLAS